jgi:hypothetical protein
MVYIEHPWGKMGPKAPFLKSIFFKKIHKAFKMKISPHPKIEPRLTLMSGILVALYTKVTTSIPV